MIIARARLIGALSLRDFRLHIRPRGCDGRAMPVGLSAATVRLIPSIRATSATRPARRDGREDRRRGTMPPRRFVTDFLPTPSASGAPPRRGRRGRAPHPQLPPPRGHPSPLAPRPPSFLRRRRREPPVRRAPRDAPAPHPDDARAAHVPECIVGDLDSIRPEVLRFYVDAGARAVDLSHDQETTDLHKAVTAMVARPEPEADANANADAKPPLVASSSSARWAAGSITRCRT